MSLFLFVVEYLDKHLSGNPPQSNPNGISFRDQYADSVGDFMQAYDMSRDLAVTGGKLPGLVAKHDKLIDAALLRSEMIAAENFTITDPSAYMSVSILRSEGRIFCALVDAQSPDPLQDIQPLIEKIFYAKEQATAAVNTQADRIRGPFRWFAFRLDEPGEGRPAWTVAFLKAGGNGGDR